MAEIRTRTGWAWLGGARAPRVGESETIAVRALAPGAVLGLGGVVSVVADHGGVASLAPRDHPEIRGHIGLVEVQVDGVVVGEVEIVPDKMSEDAYRVLRGELEAVWTGLVLDPEGSSRLAAGPPPPAELWRRIEAPVQRVIDEPREVLTTAEGFVRHTRARRRSELTPSVQRAGLRGRAGRARVVVRSDDTSEKAMVADTLRRLADYARRRQDDVTERAVTRRIALGGFVGRGTRAGRGAGVDNSLDPRYRRIRDVRRVLVRPELEPVEGPDELRLGVQGLSRLFEYWVFLQVLLHARERFGDPVGVGFDPLRIPLGNGTTRLEIGRGATVRFPGDVVVGFEPEIRLDPRHSWMGLEYVMPPDSSQRLATPDVVVLRGGKRPAAVVVDAKYIARGLVEGAATDLHRKYARMRLAGAPVVRHVWAAHPHATLPTTAWAGFGYLPMCPGQHVASIDLAPLGSPTVRSAGAGGRAVPPRERADQIAQAAQAITAASRAAGGSVNGAKASAAARAAAPDLIDSGWLGLGFLAFVEAHVPEVRVQRNESGGVLWLRQEGSR